MDRCKARVQALSWFGCFRLLVCSTQANRHHVTTLVRLDVSICEYSHGWPKLQI